MQPITAAIAAMNGSRALRGTPRALPSAFQPCPNEGGFLVEGQDPSGQQGLRPVMAGKPVFEVAAAFALRQFKHAAVDFCHRERGNMRLLVRPIRHPVEQSLEEGDQEGPENLAC